MELHQNDIKSTCWQLSLFRPWRLWAGFFFFFPNETKSHQKRNDLRLGRLHSTELRKVGKSTRYGHVHKDGNDNDNDTGMEMTMTQGWQWQWHKDGNDNDTGMAMTMTQGWQWQWHRDGNDNDTGMAMTMTQGRQWHRDGNDNDIRTAMTMTQGWHRQWHRDGNDNDTGMAMTMTQGRQWQWHKDGTDNDTGMTMTQGWQWQWHKDGNDNVIKNFLLSFKIAMSHSTWNSADVSTLKSDWQGNKIIFVRRSKNFFWTLVLRWRQQSLLLLLKQKTKRKLLK